MNSLKISISEILPGRCGVINTQQHFEDLMLPFFSYNLRAFRKPRSYLIKTSQKTICFLKHDVNGIFSMFKSFKLHTVHTISEQFINMLYELCIYRLHYVVCQHGNFFWRYLFVCQIVLRLQTTCSHILKSQGAWRKYLSVFLLLFSLFLCMCTIYY